MPDSLNARCVSSNRLIRDRPAWGGVNFLRILQRGIGHYIREDYHKLVLLVQVPLAATD